MSDHDKKTKSGKSRSQPLRRGKACLNCRHLKIKCDGVRPVCGQCTRVPKDDPCEFTDVSSRTMDLENTVYRLQSRINELEGIPGPSTGYGIPGWPVAESSRMNSPFSGSSADSRDSPRAGSDNSFLGVQEPPLVMIQMLLDYFLPHAAQFGFFLHIDRFREAALLPVDWADPRRPSPALLSVVYLWGVHLSFSQPLLSSEPVFLKRAQQNISGEITEASNSLHLLQIIQAQVLLSTYMFRNKRFLEAEFHANGAATLALGYQLHKIRSARPVSPPLLGVPVLVEAYLAPPADPIEEGERIRGFWNVACLQSSLNIALNAASINFSIFESSGSSIDTPWPGEISEYISMPSAGYKGQETIKGFLTQDPPPSSSVPTFYAKAAVLLHRASRLASNWSPNLEPQEAASYAASCTWLDGRITKFWETLPPLYSFYAESAKARTLVVAHAMTAAAAIKLHRSPGSVDVDGQKKCIFAARAILACLSDTRIPDFTIAHPIAGSMCMMACRVLMDEVRKAKAFRGAWGESLLVEPPPAGAEEIALVSDLQGGITTMRMYAVGCPLIQYQLSKLQQQYDSLY
ncbi:Zn(2)-C6 fungal-type domain-containing protein [Mycena sanguinolenta]|uniref:Zn(2)-C6 fungal-type domain-containing protein n=1 Tax=Mycena sanguinolenta TaxID=230812 RepID=A0A8H6X661_9AGAR|nr:Zn(2)-C6 fungal-type domain-containing protein [Mycena sanguinolenta]